MKKYILIVVTFLFGMINVSALNGETFATNSTSLCEKNDNVPLGLLYSITENNETLFYLLPKYGMDYPTLPDNYKLISINNTIYNENIFDVASYFYIFKNAGKYVYEYFYKFLWEYLYPNQKYTLCNVFYNPLPSYDEQDYNKYKNIVLSLMEGLPFAKSYPLNTNIEYEFTYKYLNYFEIVTSDGANVKMDNETLIISLPENKDYNIVLRKKDNDGAEAKLYSLSNNFAITYPKFKEKLYTISFVKEENITDNDNEEINFIPEKTLKISPIIFLPVLISYVFIKKKIHL